MKVPKILTTITTGVGVMTLAGATLLAGVLAYASFKAPRMEGRPHV